MRECWSFRAVVFYCGVQGSGDNRIKKRAKGARESIVAFCVRLMFGHTSVTNKYFGKTLCICQACVVHICRTDPNMRTGHGPDLGVVGCFVADDMGLRTQQNGANQATQRLIRVAEQGRGMGGTGPPSRHARPQTNPHQTTPHKGTWYQYTRRGPTPFTGTLHPPKRCLPRTMNAVTNAHRSHPQPPSTWARARAHAQGTPAQISSREARAGARSYPRIRPANGRSTASGGPSAGGLRAHGCWGGGAHTGRGESGRGWLCTGGEHRGGGPNGRGQTIVSIPRLRPLIPLQRMTVDFVLFGMWATPPPPPGDALEGKEPQRRPQRRSDRRLDRQLEEVTEAVGGGYCRLQMPLRLALGGQWLGRGWASCRGVPPPLRETNAPRIAPCAHRALVFGLLFYALLADFQCGRDAVA